ncbi:MAG: energy transducer TonB, partial [Candidatus Binatia bacterium]
NQVEAVIKKNWTWVGADPNLTIRVGFRIGEDGTIADLRVLARSGDGTFDESVMRAIRVSTPLPPPPEKYREVFGNYVLEFVSGELAKSG